MRHLICALLIFASTGFWLFNPSHAGGIANYASLYESACPGDEGPAWAMAWLRVRQAQSVPYDLTNGGARTVPIEITWPTAPQNVNSQTINVTANSFSSLQAALLSTTNATVNIPAGTYGDGSQTLFVRGTDLRVVCSNDATIDCAVIFGNRNVVGFPRRIHWSGGNFTTGTFNLDKIDDLLLDDVHSVTDGQSDVTRSNRWTGRSDAVTSETGCKRVAAINSTFQVINGGATDNLAMFMGFEADPGFTSVQEDIIYANCVFRSTTQTTRWMAVRRMIIVDSLINDDLNAAISAFRIHVDSEDIWVADSHIAGDALFNFTDYTTSDPGGVYWNVINGIFENVTRYQYENSPPRSDIGSTASGAGTIGNSGVWRNCRVYTIASVTDGEAAGTGQFTNENCQAYNWNGTTFPMPDYYGTTIDPDTYGAQRAA